MTRLINYSNACNVLDSARCMRYHTSPRSSPHDATKNIIVNGYNQRLYGYKYPVNGNMDITSDTTYDAWTYDSITHAYVHNNSTAIINGYMYIHAFIANHTQISMYKLTTNNQYHLHTIIQQHNSSS